MEKTSVVLAVFNSTVNSNTISKGEGFTEVEAAIRAVGHPFEENDIQPLIQEYGPDNIGGLMEFYEDHGYYISEPFSKIDMKSFIGD